VPTHLVKPPLAVGGHHPHLEAPLVGGKGELIDAIERDSTAVGLKIGDRPQQPALTTTGRS